jgi:tRNA A37 N6-isopentenylltransferase MiaA
MRETQLADANARKARMQAMDRERANKIPPTDIERAQRNKDVGILSKA